MCHSSKILLKSTILETGVPAIVQVHLACKCGSGEARIRIWALHITGAAKCWSAITLRGKGGLNW